MAVIDVVKWNASPGVLAWKFPSQELSAKTQLIVSESQEAIFLKDGNAFGPLGPGRHVIDTLNYPFLTSLVKFWTKDSPFPAEIWFVQRTFKLDIKWGTLGVIQVEDPKYHIMLPIRGFGQYGVTVDDSARFLLKLVGTLPWFTEESLKEYFKGVVVTNVKDMIGKCLVERNISVLQMSAYLNEFSERVGESISAIMAEYKETFRIYCKLLTSNQLSLIKAIAHEGKVKEVNGREFLEKYQPGAASSVRNAVSVLLDKELLTEDEDGYSVYDRFFGLWLRQWA